MAIDTEFLREKTFLPIPALIQISDGETCFLFDPIQCDLKLLGEFLVSSQQIKIFHSGSQDYEVFDLFVDHQRLPNTVDTQLAAQFLNSDQSMGLGNLISNILNIEIGKTETVSDWTKRPLTEKQLTYACEDVLYLHQVYALLEHRLKKAKKFDYFIQECQIQNQLKDPTINMFEKHIKSTDSLKLRAIFKDLLSWREDMALRKNLPRNWILKDVQLKKIAKVNDPQQWLNSELLTEKQVSSYSKDFNEIHIRHQSLSSKAISISHQEKIDFEKLFGLIKNRLQRCANRAELPVELICNQRTLKQKVHQMIHTKKFEPFEEWRGELLNSSLQQVFDQFFS